jgi:hypothetical protein
MNHNISTQKTISPSTKRDKGRQGKPNPAANNSEEKSKKVDVRIKIIKAETGKWATTLSNSTLFVIFLLYPPFQLLGWELPAPAWSTLFLGSLALGSLVIKLSATPCKPTCGASEGRRLVWAWIGGELWRRVLVGTSEGRMAGEGDPRGRNGTSK